MHLDNHTIAKYVDGALTDSERARARRHIGDCGACAAIVGDVARVVAEAGVSEDSDVGDRAQASFRSLDPDERTRRAAEAIVGGETIVKLPRAGWVAAALIVVAIGIGALVAGDIVLGDLVQRDSDTQRFRGTESVTDFALVEPADGDTIEGGRPSLSLPRYGSDGIAGLERIERIAEDGGRSRGVAGTSILSVVRGCADAGRTAG